MMRKLKIITAALELIEHHTADHPRPCDCVFKAISAARYSAGGNPDECDIADDPEACCVSLAATGIWDKVKNQVTGNALVCSLEWFVLSNEVALSGEVGMAAAAEGALGAEGVAAGMGVAEAVVAGLAGLKGLEFPLTLLGLL